MADRAPSVRSAPNEPFEHRGEMGLRLESNCQSDLGDGHGCVLQQFFSPPNSSLQKKLVRSQACRHPELGGKVHSAQSGNHSQIREVIFAERWLSTYSTTLLRRHFCNAQTCRRIGSIPTGSTAVRTSDRRRRRLTVMASRRTSAQCWSFPPSAARSAQERQLIIGSSEFFTTAVRHALDPRNVGDRPRVPICVVQLCHFLTQKPGVMDRGILGRCIICSVDDA